MINTSNDRSAGRRRLQYRAAFAGALGALALAAGAGVASAADAPTGTETGYAVVVDESTTPTAAGALCPDQADSTDGDF